MFLEKQGDLKYILIVRLKCNVKLYFYVVYEYLVLHLSTMFEEKHLLFQSPVMRSSSFLFLFSSRKLSRHKQAIKRLTFKTVEEKRDIMNKLKLTDN